MSLTVIYRGKYVKFATALKKSLWIPALMAILATSGWVWHFHSVVDAERAQVESQLKDVRAQYQAHITELASLKDKAKYQLNAVQSKVGELQGQVNRINAFSEELAKVASIPQSKFNFLAPSAVGGLLHEAAEISETASAATLMQQMDDLILQLDGQEQKMALLESLLLNHNIEKNTYLSGRPTRSGWLSSYYGMRKDPFTGLPADHKGIDFAGKQGDVVIATGSGVISWAGERYGYGQLVEIDHGDGFKTRYGHNETLLVEAGDVVDKGQVIAKMGSSGRSTGPHVHYEILKNGHQINPLKYVYRRTK